MRGTLSVAEYDALYDGFCRVRNERDAAIARAEAAEAQVERLRAALGEYATDANWRLDQRFDPNSPNFEGTLVARAALAPDDSTFTRAALAGKEPADG